MNNEITINEEYIKELCKKEFLNNIKENIKSETIFTYVDGLEKENKKQKEVLDKIKDIVDSFMPNEAKLCEALDEISKLLEEIE